MRSQEHLASPSETVAVVPGGSASQFAKRLGWDLLGSPPGRSVALRVCRLMSRNLEKRRGPPALASPSGVVRLWRIEKFRDVSWSPRQPWALHDGVLLNPDDPVLEFHLAGDCFMELLRTAPWRGVIQQEFHSLAPLLQSRHEVALVGTTILRPQVTEFGASLRELPAGIHTSLDTFYRKLIVLAFHPRGAKRVLSTRQPLAEAAISRQEFCRRYG